MAYCDMQEMYEGRYNWKNTSKVNHCRSRTPVMEFESDWTKHRNSSAYTAHVIRPSTSFMPWSSRIPMGEEYFEFL